MQVGMRARRPAEKGDPVGDRRYVKPPWMQRHVGNRERYLASYRAASDWSHNLEASHAARLAQRGHVEDIEVADVPVAERAPLLAGYGKRYGKMPTVGPVLRALPDPADHPIFRVTEARAAST